MAPVNRRVTWTVDKTTGGNYRTRPMNLCHVGFGQIFRQLTPE